MIKKDWQTPDRVPLHLAKYVSIKKSVPSDSIIRKSSLKTQFREKLFQNKVQSELQNGNTHGKTSTIACT